MPFIDSELTKKHWLMLVVFAATFAVGQYVGTLQERAKHKIVLTTEAQELSQQAVFNPKTVNPNDAMLWSAFLPQAKLCDDCNALMEHSDSSMHHIRPVVVRMYDDTRTTGYIMVLGTVGYVPGQKHVDPTVTYYIGHRSGALVRVNEDGTVVHRISSNEWRPLSNADHVRDEARRFFHEKWRAQLASTKH